MVITPWLDSYSSSSQWSHIQHEQRVIVVLHPLIWHRLVGGAGPYLYYTSHNSSPFALSSSILSFPTSSPITLAATSSSTDTATPTTTASFEPTAFFPCFLSHFAPPPSLRLHSSHSGSSSRSADTGAGDGPEFGLPTRTNSFSSSYGPSGGSQWLNRLVWPRG